MIDDPALVRRGAVVLHADPRRVISKLLVPGREMASGGLPGGVVSKLLLPGHPPPSPMVSHAGAVIDRVLAMSERDVSATLAATVDAFEDRHHDLRGIFAQHFGLIADRLPEAAGLSAERRDLIGAYCTQEFSVESAALFNPSIVVHPDQTGAPAGGLRFVMSVRAVGEGHVSSIEFRTGEVRSSGDIRVDDPGRHLVTGQAAPLPMSRDFLRDAVADGIAVAERAAVLEAERIISHLPERFDASHLEAAIEAADAQSPVAGRDTVVDTIRRIAGSDYRLQFPPHRPLPERVIYPTGDNESHGVEDARFTRFVDDGGGVTYYATYTAYNGFQVAPRLLQTNDFVSFDSTQLIGSAAKNKGMALFPRCVAGQYLALSRWDGESIGITGSTDVREWSGVVTVQRPTEAWELIQLGNCGSPIETPEGWLVLMHGVGPMRTYSIGAILLDLDDPSRVVGALKEPILTANADEREGYVPNVVYSCGALQHEDMLVLPYGCSDASIRMALVDLPELLGRLRRSGRR